MALQPTGDQRFERVELAAAFRTAAWAIGLGAGIFGGRFRIDGEFARDLRETQAAFAVVEADFAVSFVVDHGCEVRRRISATGSVSPVREGVGGNGSGPSSGSRLRT
jgi:hypothetical protein